MEKRGRSKQIKIRTLHLQVINWYLYKGKKGLKITAWITVVAIIRITELRDVIIAVNIVKRIVRKM